MKTGILIGMCGCRISITEEDLGFDEVECEICGTHNPCPETWEEVDAQNNNERALDVSTHYRIMARGEDGQEFCVKNMIEKNEELDGLILAGVQASYPEATVWTEDEEMMNPVLRHRTFMGFDDTRNWPEEDY